MLDFATWVLGSLAAIGLLTYHPYLGLAAAIGGGAFLGVASFVATTDRPVKASKEHPVVPARMGRLAWVAEQEPWLLAVSVPILVLSEWMPRVLPPLAFLLLPLPWICRRLTKGFFTRSTGLGVPILALLLMLPVALYAAVDWDLSRPRVYGILAGVALFYGLVNWVNSRRRAWLALMGLLSIGIALSVVALMITQWNYGKLLPLAPLYGRFPALAQDLVQVNANVLAGVLALIFPIPLALLFFGAYGRGKAEGGAQNVSHPPPPSSRFGRRLLPSTAPSALFPDGDESVRMLPILRAGWGLCAALLLGVLLLTQSRGAWMALAAGVFVLAVFRSRWALLAILIIPGAAFIAVQRWGLQTMPVLAVRPGMDWVFNTGAVQGWEGRQEVWSRALYALQDFPFTGVGLGNFVRVIPVLYPYFLLSPDAPPHHAHNLFLQVAMDLGMPGLLAFSWLFFGSLAASWRALRIFRQRGIIDLQSMALGLLVSLLVMALHGLTDSVTWGTVTAIVSWYVMGMAVALQGLSRDWNLSLSSPGEISTTTRLCHSEERSDEESRLARANCWLSGRFLARRLARNDMLRVKSRCSTKEKGSSGACAMHPIGYVSSSR